MFNRLLQALSVTALSAFAIVGTAHSAPTDLSGDAFLKPIPANRLYEKFRSPDNASRPFVRWWWNGTRICEAEIVRELDSMQRAGFGGVEINSIAFPNEFKDTLGYAQVPWLSERWLELVKFTVEEAHKRGMYSDLIVGSGWPFGGEFLTRDQ